jgi:NodT family efflux transporter outer membrane factor (OMF) lipoprotein
MRTAIILSVVLALTGCMTVGPDYKPPATEMPAKWHTIQDPAVTPGKDAILYWWIVFDDPMLTRLIGQAAAGNLELKAAVARIKEARARLEVVAGERYPQIDSRNEIARERISESTGFGFSYTATRHTVALDSSWELDLFGRISRSIEAASANYQATEEDRTDVLVSLYAEVARQYLIVRTLQARLTATLGNIESQKQILELTRLRFQFGLASDLDVAQAENVLATSEAQLPPLRNQLDQAINAIDVLLGRPPGALYSELSEVRPIPLPQDTVAIGVPTDLLRRRPDIRRTERELAAQTARIGVATADLYPSFSLFGTFGLEAIELGDLVRNGSRFYSYGPRLSWNVFSGGRIRSQIKVEDALTEQALLQYEQTVLNALNEVEDALSTYVEARNRVQALERAVAASNRTLELAIRLYKEGLSDFQNVLDAERTVFDSENQLADANGNVAISLVQVYRTLGGGWTPDRPSLPAPADESDESSSDREHQS